MILKIVIKTTCSPKREGDKNNHKFLLLFSISPATLKMVQIYINWIYNDESKQWQSTSTALTEAIASQYSLQTMMPQHQLQTIIS